MKVDAAFEQLRRANPEPDPAALRRHLQEIAHPVAIRSETMDTSTTTIEPEPRTKAPRRWLPALAAGALVLLLGIPVLVLRNEGGLLGIFSTTPVEIAERYMQARNAWDADRARSLLADDVVMNDMPMIRNLDELEPGFEALRVYEITYTPFECRQAREGPPAVVVCDYRMDTVLSRIVGYRPVPGSLQFTISDGRITYVQHNFNFGEFAPNVFQKFVDWLEAEHPGAYEDISRTERGTDTPILTPEALDLARSYIAEYAEFVNASGG